MIFVLIIIYIKYAIEINEKPQGGQRHQEPLYAAKSWLLFPHG
jgi:hypothetical protein